MINLLCKSIAIFTLLITVFLTSGCESSGGTRVSAGYSVYSGYGYPYYGNDYYYRPPVNRPDRPNPPDRPNRPEQPIAKPPAFKPPGNIGRPKPMPSRPANRSRAR